MKISTKGRYALRLMIDVALHDYSGPVRIRDIAERQNISDKYLEQIVSVLTKGGLLISLRGPQGGYKLSKDINDYTAGLILRTVEGSLAPVACLDTEVNMCSRSDFCPTVILWQKLYDAITDVVDNVTLADLRQWAINGLEKEAQYSI